MKRLLRWIWCWATLIQSVVGVLTLGFWVPQLSFKVAKWKAKLIYQKERQDITEVM